MVIFHHTGMIGNIYDPGLEKMLSGINLQMPAFLEHQSGFVLNAPIL
jgi:hypothetical protein